MRFDFILCDYGHTDLKGKQLEGSEFAVNNDQFFNAM